MFHGSPSLRGVAPGPLARRFRLLWRFRTAGPVKSSPVIADGRVYVGSDDGSIYALGLADGKRLRFPGKH